VHAFDEDFFAAPGWRPRARNVDLPLNKKQKKKNEKKKNKKNQKKEKK